MQNTLRDKLLLFKVRNRKDPEAFGKIYDAYASRIYRFLYFKVPTVEEAQDLTSETFLRLWQYLQEGKPVKNLGALAYQIARNLAIDFYRARADRATASADVPLEDIADSRGLRAIESQLEIGTILRALRLLKDEYREAIILRYVDELSPAEIATVLGKSNGNVRVIIHRAVESLRMVLKDKG